MTIANKHARALAEGCTAQELGTAEGSACPCLWTSRRQAHLGNVQVEGGETPLSACKERQLVQAVSKSLLP